MQPAAMPAVHYMQNMLERSVPITREVDAENVILGIRHRDLDGKC